MRLQEKMVTIALRGGGGAALEGVFLAGASDDDRCAVIAPPPALVAPARIAALRARVLVLTGDRDDFVPLGALQNGLAQADHVRLEVLAGADHFFGSGTRPLSTLASDWLGGTS